jgi:hypothetical protein
MPETHAPYPFKRITARSRISGGGTRISWTMDEYFQDALPHTFTLQVSRSTVSTATWENVGLSAVNTDFLIDSEDRYLGMEADYQYRVKVVTPIETYYSPGIRMDHRLEFRDWRHARDMFRKELLRHDKYVSLPGWLLKRRKDGTACPLCLDPAGNPDDSRCPRCFGTRFDGGYFAPERAYLQLEVNARTVDTDDKLATVQETPQIQNCRMLSEPSPQSRDIFVDGVTDRRYHIDTIVSAAMIRSYTIVNIVHVRPMAMGDIVYDYEISDEVIAGDRDTLTPVFP